MQIISYISLLRGRSARADFIQRTSRSFRSIVAMLSVFLLTGVPAHAGPVAISEVIQVIGNYQNPPDLRLRSLTQTGTPISGIKGSTVSGVKQSGANGDTVASGGKASDSVLAGVVVISDDTQRGVEIIDQGDVEGTICDCGEIAILGGGFPKWPLLFLAAVPLFFINTGGDIDTPTSTFTPPLTPVPLQIPTPPPQVTAVPEPASLLLFGTGLAVFGAGFRRRRANAIRAALAADAKEAE